jgi:hypothetical protein
MDVRVEYVYMDDTGRCIFITFVGIRCQHGMVAGGLINLHAMPGMSGIPSGFPGFMGPGGQMDGGGPAMQGQQVRDAGAAGVLRVRCRGSRCAARYSRPSNGEG